MLVTTQLDNCPGCKDLSGLIEELDCLIASQAQAVLNAQKYGFKIRLSRDVFKQAVRLKRLITARTYNPQYAGTDDISDIINIVKRIIYGL